MRNSLAYNFERSITSGNMFLERNSSYTITIEMDDNDSRMNLQESLGLHYGIY